MELDGRVALVTGGASGTGRATAERLVKEGMRVCVVDIDGDAARATAEPLGALGLECDVSDPDHVDAVFDECARRCDGLDLVHMNASVAINWSGDIGTMELTQYHRSLCVNLDGVVYGARAAVRTMRAYEGDGGVIVASASIAGVVPFVPDPILTIGKHGVIGLVRSIAPHLAEEGIAVHAICAYETGMDGRNEQMGRIDDSSPSAEHVADAVVLAARAPLSTAGTCWLVQAGEEPEPVAFTAFDGLDTRVSLHR